MPLETLSPLRPRSATAAGVHASLLQFIAAQERNNNYLENIQAMVSGAGPSDLGKVIMVDPLSTSSNPPLILEDVRGRVRLEDVLSASQVQTDAGSTTRTIDLGSTGEASLVLRGAPNAGNRFQVVLDGDTGTSSAFAVDDADSITLDGISIALTSTGTISLDNATIASLAYPTSDGTSGDAIVTDGAGGLSLETVKQFSETASGSTQYTTTYEPIDGHLSVTPEDEVAIPVSSYHIRGFTSGFGGMDSSSSSALHSLFIQYHSQFMLRASYEVGGYRVIQMGNDATEFAAGTVTPLKPPIADSTSATHFSPPHTTLEGSIFYDDTLHTLHYVDDASLLQIATTADITGKLDVSGGVTGSILALQPSTDLTRLATDPDLKFVDADGSGWYAKTAELSSNKAISFYDGLASTHVVEFEALGISGVDQATQGWDPRLRFATGGNLASTPGYAFTGDQDTGMYLGGPNTLSFSVGGVNAASVTYSGGWNFNNFKLTNITTPTSSTDAATKSYVDGIIAPGVVADSTLSYDISSGKWTPNTTVSTPADGTLELGVPSTAGGALQLRNASTTYYTEITSAVTAADIELTLPPTAGNSGDIIKTDGTGVLSFVPISTVGDSRYVRSSAPVLAGGASFIAGSRSYPSLFFDSTYAGLYYTSDNSSGSSSDDDPYTSSGIVFQTALAEKILTVGECVGNFDLEYPAIYGSEIEAPEIIMESRVGPVYTFVGHDQTGIGFDYIYAADLDTSSSSGGSDTYSTQDAMLFYVRDASAPVFYVLDDRIEMGFGVKLTGLPSPTDSQDAATKLYVDTQVGSVVAPQSTGALGELLTYDVASQTPEFNSGLVFTSDILQVGDTSGLSGPASIMLSTSYTFIGIGAPSESSSESFTGYTLILPEALGSAGQVLGLSDSVGPSHGTLTFTDSPPPFEGGTMKVSMSTDYAFVSTRAAMVITLGSSPQLDPWVDPGDPTFTSSLSSPTGTVDIRMGSSSANFIKYPQFKVSVNGLELIKGHSVIWKSDTEVLINTRLKNNDIIYVQGLDSAVMATMGY